MWMVRREEEESQPFLRHQTISRVNLLVRWSQGPSLHGSGPGSSPTTGLDPVSPPPTFHRVRFGRRGRRGQRASSPATTVLARGARAIDAMDAMGGKHQLPLDCMVHEQRFLELLAEAHPPISQSSCLSDLLRSH